MRLADNVPDQFEEHQDQEQEYTEQQQGEGKCPWYIEPRFLNILFYKIEFIVYQYDG